MVPAQPAVIDSYFLGTDPLGRDILSRIIHGTRISLLVGITAVLISGTIGTLLGLLSGFYRGWLDAVIMRIDNAVSREGYRFIWTFSNMW